MNFFTLGFYDKVSIASQFFSAIAFAGVMVWIWFKMIAPAIQTAQENENKGIALTELHLEESRQAVGLLHQEIDGAARDAEAIRKRAAELAAFEREAALADAKEQGERTLRNAAGELDRARAAGRDRLRTELVDRALEIAKSRAVARVDAPTDAKLIQSFVASVEKSTANG
jgi:F0F1-type ATP synthase membrane subunit b/b'